jgi:hypothetical protein
VLGGVWIGLTPWSSVLHEKLIYTKGTKCLVNGKDVPTQEVVNPCQETIV